MTASDKINIIFGMDILSPFSYVAFEILKRYESKWNINIDYLPAILPDIMKLSENLSPLQSCENKREYIKKDLYKMCMATQVHFELPYKFPCNTQLVQKMLIVIKQDYPTVLKDCIDFLWTGYMSEGRRIEEEEEEIKDIISKAFILHKVDNIKEKVDAILIKASTQDIENQLNQNTQYLFSKGAFGMPYFIVMKDSKEECFFGCDRIESLADYLNLDYNGFNPDVEFIKNNDIKDKKLIVSIDVLSAYCYIARQMLKKYEDKWDIQVDYVPVHLDTIRKSAGNATFMELCENKRNHLIKDVVRVAQQKQTLLNLPTQTEFNSLPALALLSLIKEHHFNIYVQAIDVLFESALSKDLDIKNKEVLKQVLSSLLNQNELNELVELAFGEQKQKLILDESNQLVSKGAFGLPYFIATKKQGEDVIQNHFFGSDRIELLAHFLNVKY